METREIAIDTEGLPRCPWGLSYSTEPYRAVVVLAGDQGGLAAVQRAIEAASAVILHNALHDIAVLRDMGLSIPDDKLQDTMSAAYLIGIEPQGLKPLAYRHAGMTHQSYMDVVGEADNRLAFNWLLELFDRLPADPKDTLPAKPSPKMIERYVDGVDQKAEYVQRVTAWESYTPPPPASQCQIQARKLVGKMLEKGDPDETRTLRARWTDGRARELLVDETETLPQFEADPPEATLDDIPFDEAVAYSARDADATIRIWAPLRQRLSDYQLDDVYQTDMAIIPMIDRMQAVGLGVDLDHFRSLSAMLAIELELNQEAICRCIGRPLNPNSGPQVAELLFDQLALHEHAPNVRLKRTKSKDRFSTNDKTLEALSHLHPIVPLITDGREIRKIKGTYADQIPRLMGRDGRLHPRFRITRTDTGRLSAADPNVLAFPKHSERGKFIRQGFVAGPGRMLGEWDLRQIEMVVFAVDAEDEVMLGEIRAGLDKHTATAARMYHRDPADVQAEHDAKTQPGAKQRFTAKAVNFGTLMGITEHGLTDQMHKNGLVDWTVNDSVDTIEAWRDAYPGGWAYIKAKHAEGRRYGFVRDMWGRLRWLEGIRSPDDYIRSEAERQAQATPIQSGAQGVIKRNMGALWPKLKMLRSYGIWVECLLQIHDALFLEFDESARDIVNDIVMEAMTQTVELPVPIEASADFGQRLGDL